MQVRYQARSRSEIPHKLFNEEINNNNLNEVDKSGFYTWGGVNIRMYNGKFLELCFSGPIQDSNYLFMIHFTPKDLFLLLPYIFVILKGYKIGSILKLFQK